MTKIWQVWQDAVGAPVAQNAKPHAFRDNVLIVHVSSSAWIHQLTFLEKDMLAGLNDRIAPARVNKLRFKIGKIHG